MKKIISCICAEYRDHPKTYLADWIITKAGYRLPVLTTDAKESRKYTIEKKWGLDMERLLLRNYKNIKLEEVTE